MVTAWLQRDDSGRTAAPQLQRGFRAFIFRMRLARAFMPAPAHHLAITHDHAAYARVGAGAVQSLFRQAQGLGHVRVVGAKMGEIGIGIGIAVRRCVL